MKLLEAVEKLPWVAYLDDERELGSPIMITLHNDYEFCDDPGCGVRGFDTVTQTKKGTRRAYVQLMQKTC